jgi:hypothetical protein
MSDAKVFAIAGIVTDGKGRSKVRFGNDLAGRIKVLSKSAGASRLDFVSLPQSMTKLDAVTYLMAHEDFKSPQDQAVLSDALLGRTPKAPSASKAKTVAKKVAVAKKNTPSIEAIKARTKKPAKATVTVKDVLTAVAK